jgi:GT2 family glycosyltransferase
MLNVAISIIHYNNNDATTACLKSLCNLDLQDLHITTFVIDNGSTDAYILPKHVLPRTHLIRNENNTGFSGGQNIGIRQALASDADYILVLNNDTIVDALFIKALIACANKHSDAGIISPKIYYAPGSEYHISRYSKMELGHVLWYAGGWIDWRNISGKHRGVDEVDLGQFDKSEQISFATGCCMLIKKEILEKIGLFDERYFLYYEDADFCERVKNAGFTLWYEPKSVIWHKNAEAGGGSGSALQEYYVSRNRMLFGFSYGSIRTKFALFRESLRLMIQGRKWQKKGITDFYSRRFGQGSYR